MEKVFIKFHDITFAYESAAEPLLLNLTLHISPGWTGIVGANGVGKTTLLKLTAGLLPPAKGQIERPDHSFYCPQHTGLAYPAVSQP